MEIAGKPVRNAKKPIVLVITSDDVKKGATRDPASCAAALACKRQMNAAEARVHTGRTYVRIKDEWIRFNTPVSLQKEIVAFDRGGSFEPGEYELRPLPVSHIKRQGKRQGSAGRLSVAEQSKKYRREKSAGLAPKRRKVHITTGVRAHGANK